MAPETIGPLGIPHAIEEVTPGWLTDALSRDRPGLIVNDATVTGDIHGASTKARVRLRTNRNDAPVSVIVKAGFEPHSRAMRSMHDNEMHAYRDLIPTLEVNAPRWFFASRDEAGHSLVILEDLDERGVRSRRLCASGGLSASRCRLRSGREGSISLSP